MKYIRSAMAAALMVFGGATIAAAQQPAQQPTQQQAVRHANGGKFRRNGQKQLFRGVQLSSTERANMKAVHQRYASQMKALRSSNTTDRSQMMALRQSERNDLRGALSSANQAKFDANVAKMKSRATKRGNPIKP
jgi:Spy/CpxP family protein refolding chaperone